MRYVLLKLGLAGKEAWKEEGLRVERRGEPQENAGIVQPLEFLCFYFFEVVGVNVVPQLPQQPVVGVVVGVGVLVGHPEVDAV